VLKHDSISKFFDEILDGTATVTSSGSQSPEGSHKLSPEEEDIERKQEAQRLALLHGGYADMIDFEKAIKKHGAGFHGEHGYSASLDDELKTDDTNKGEYEHEREEDPMHRAIRIQREEQAISEAQMAAETLPLSTVKELKGTPQASPGTSTSGSTVVAPSGAPSLSEKESVPTQEITPPETAHVKDEL
jgi:protein disulfide-isomerase A6